MEPSSHLKIYKFEPSSQMQIIKAFKECPECGSKIDNVPAEVQKCHNGKCNYVETAQVFELLTTMGANPLLLKQLKASMPQPSHIPS